MHLRIELYVIVTVQIEIVQASNIFVIMQATKCYKQSIIIQTKTAKV